MSSDEHKLHDESYYVGVSVSFTGKKIKGSFVRCTNALLEMV